MRGYEYRMSHESSQRACELPAAPCSLVEISARVARSKLYRIGTELGTCSRGTSASATQSNDAISARIVFECATTITVRSAAAAAAAAPPPPPPSASSNSAGAIAVSKHSSARVSRRRAVSGLGRPHHSAVTDFSASKRASARAWQSARLSVSGAGAGRHSGWSSAIGGGVAFIARRHERSVSSPKRAAIAGSFLRSPCSAP